MLKEKSKMRRILVIMYIIITLFGTIQPIFAVSSSGTGKWVSGQWDSNVYTTDNKTSVGMLIRRLVNYTTGEKLTVFCCEHGVDSPTGEIHTATHTKPTDEKMKQACRVAYFGWYSKYGNYAVDGGIMADNGRKMDYVYTQQMIWEVLGQSNATFRDSNIQNGYVNFKNEVNSKINNIRIQPSFINDTITVEAGETKTISDSNNVLKDYVSFDKTVDGIRVAHTKGQNTLSITVDENCTRETYKISESTMKSWGIIKEETADKDTTVYFVFTEGVQNQLYALDYNDPVGMLLDLKINLYGKLELAKKDNKGNYIPNTTFKISRNADMSEPIGTYTTGSNGKVAIDQLKKGTIYIQEVSVPEHLILDTTIKNVEIQPAKTTTYEATNNWKQGKIQVVKKDAESNKVVKKAGTIFDIYNTNNAKLTSITTNENGVAISGLLDYGTYYVKEQKAPNKYTIKVEVSENIGVIENGKTYEISVLNTRVKGSVTISKEDSKTGKQPQGEATLEGAVYGLYARTPILDPTDDSMIYNTDVKVGELVTNKEANATLDNLYLGEYYIKEIKPSKGYTLDTNRYNFDLLYEGQNVKIVTKKQTVKERVISQPFEIIKISSDEAGEAELLEGAEFTIKAQKDIEQYGSWEQAPIAKNADGKTTKVLVTDNKGYAVSERLPFGTYVVRETKVPEDKYKVNDFKVVITNDSAEPQVWRVFNDTSFNAILEIVKQDAETRKVIKIEGAKFKIKNLDTGKYFGYWNWSPLPHYIDSWTTNELGRVMTGDKLEVGNYQLEEQKSPKGYLISKNPVEFRITSNTAYKTLEDGKTPVITVIQKDTSVKGKVNIEKKGEVLVDYKDGKFVYEERGLANAKYEIIVKEDIYDPSNDGSIIYKKGTIVDTITTKDDGRATSKELPLGEYSVMEIEAPYGFVLSDEIKNVSLKYKDQNTAIVFDNTSFVNERQKLEINVFKLDEDDGKLLEGAEFSLYAKEDIMNYKGEIIMKANELIETATSDESGKATFKTDLPLLDFLIKETKAPKGYILSDEVITVNSEYQGQDVKILNLEYDIKNEKIKGYLEITKVDSKTKETLKDATFGIYDMNDNEIAQITTDETGKAKSELIPYGKYYAKELSTGSVYYLLNENTYKFEIVENNEIVPLTIENDSVDIEVTVDKEGTTEIKPGEEVNYEFSNVGNASNVYLENFKWFDYIPTDYIRLETMTTGTWNQDLTYNVYYKTNKSDDYVLFKENLKTTENYNLDFTTMEFAEDEYIVETMFDFGKVDVGFKEDTKPTMVCKSFDTLKESDTFTNYTKTVGVYFGVTAEANSKWTTITHIPEEKHEVTLPRTGK